MFGEVPRRRAGLAFSRPLCVPQHTKTADGGPVRTADDGQRHVLHKRRELEARCGGEGGVRETGERPSEGEGGGGEGVRRGGRGGAAALRGAAPSPSCGPPERRPAPRREKRRAHAPTAVVSRPTMIVATMIVSSAVPTTIGSPKPSRRPASATPVAIDERKMSPTSCGWPTAKGSDENIVNDAWCTAAARKEKRARSPSIGLYAGSCLMVVFVCVRCVCVLCALLDGVCWCVCCECGCVHDLPLL